MRFFLISMVFCFSFNVYSLDSAMKFTTKELNENELVARSGTDIATAERVIQLQLRASGCSMPTVMSPDMFKKQAEYAFVLKSDNCVIIPKSGKCESSYSPRNMKPNPNSSADTIIGVDKYIICLKDSAGASEGHGPSSGAK